MKRIAIVLGVAALSVGFVLLSPPRKWHSNQLPRNFRIGMAVGENSLASNFTSASAQLGVSSWSAGITSDSSWSGAAPFTTTVNNNVGNVGFVNDGLSTISWEDPQNMLATGVLAATTTGYYTTSASQVVNGTVFYKITDSDVVGNNGITFTSFAEADALGANGNQYDLDSILVHEVGHALGLGHSSGEQTTMYASIGANDWRKRTLDDDDINGSRFIYVNGYHALNYPSGSQLQASSTFLGMSTAAFNPSASLLIRVQVVDEFGNQVSAANVTVSVTTNTGAVLTGTAATNSIGQVTFNAGQVKHGNWSTTVTNITKAGKTFNAAAGKRSDTCTF